MPILFYLPGNIPVYTSAVLIALGGTLGLAWVAFQSPDATRLRYLDAGLWALLGAFLGGRLLFVILNWHYFQLHPVEISLFYLGGFSWTGAYFGGFLALALVALLSKEELGTLSDALLPLLGTLTVSAWLACWLDGSAYGKISSAWWGLPAKDEWGFVAPRVPLQLMAALVSAVWTWLLASGPIRLEIPGMSASLGLLGFAIIALLISVVRSDPSRSWSGLRFDTLESLFLISFSLIAVLVAFLKGRQNPIPDDVSE